MRRACAALALAMFGLDAKAQEPEPLYSPIDDVRQLSEILGGVHALRVRCEGTGDQSWRQFMFQLLNIEAPDSGRRRDAMIAGFNAGFQRQSARFAVCTPDVRVEERRLAAEGRRLADRIGDRYRE